eukprot:461557-Rhodomonas_salina.1
MARDTVVIVSSVCTAVRDSQKRLVDWGVIGACANSLVIELRPLLSTTLRSKYTKNLYCSGEE